MNMDRIKEVNYTGFIALYLLSLPHQYRNCCYDKSKNFVNTLQI